MKYALVPLLAVFAAPIHAESVTVVPLNVKPGQWEMQREVESLPIDLRSVPPEMRDKLEQAVREKDPPKAVTRTWSSCMTAEDLRRTFSPSEGAACTNTVVGSTSSRLDLLIDCRPSVDHPRRDGTFRLEAVSPEEVRGDMRLNVGEGGDATTVVMRLTARWTGARCEEAAAGDKKK